MKTFEDIWTERPHLASLIDKHLAKSIFELGQNSPATIIYNAPSQPTICDIMLIGIEQDRLRKEARSKK